VFIAIYLTVASGLVLIHICMLHILFRFSAHHLQHFHYKKMCVYLHYKNELTIDQLGKHGYTNERKLWTQYLVGYTKRLHILI